MKTMCKKSKELPDNIRFFAEQALNPKVICCNCGRIATEKDLLCDPKKISKILKQGDESD